MGAGCGASLLFLGFLIQIMVNECSVALFEIGLECAFNLFLHGVPLNTLLSGETAT